MVAVERSPDDGHACRFVLRPNCSLSWRGNLLFFAALCLPALLIGGGLAIQGFWLVLPFTGLELLAVGAGLYVVVRRGEECEVITLQGEYIIIERGRRGPQQRWQLARAWARVVVERHPASCYPCRLLIRSYGRAVEIGRFLSGEERQRLAVELQHSL